MPKVYNMRDPNRPKDAIYGGRPRGGGVSKYGNKFTHLPHIAKRPGMILVATREEAVRRYEEDILKDPERIAQLKQEKGKDWVCWCAPLACHCDVNLRIANSEGS